jgi:hypothetical protein
LLFKWKEGGWFHFEASDDGSRYLVQNGAFELDHDQEHKAKVLFQLFRNLRALRLTSVNDLPKDCPKLLRKICSQWKDKINKQLDNLMQNGKREWLRNYCYEL